MPVSWPSMRSTARCVLPVLVGPRTTVTLRARGWAGADVAVDVIYLFFQRGCCCWCRFLRHRRDSAKAAVMRDCAAEAAIPCRMCAAAEQRVNLWNSLGTKRARITDLSGLLILFTADCAVFARRNWKIHWRCFRRRAGHRHIPVKRGAIMVNELGDGGEQGLNHLVRHSAPRGNEANTPGTNVARIADSQVFSVCSPLYLERVPSCGTSGVRARHNWGPNGTVRTAIARQN